MYRNQNELVSHYQQSKNLFLGKNTLIFRIFSTKNDLKKVFGDAANQGRKRIFVPFATLWAFVIQILSQDHSCRFAVSSVIALRSGQGKKTISSATGAYCRARLRLSLSFIQKMVHDLASLLEKKCPKEWKWKNFNVKIADGTVVSMPATTENMKIYSKATGSTGLPKIRLVGIFSLATGALLSLVMGPHLGKGSGEVSLFRKLIDGLQHNDLLLLDRLFSGFPDMALMLYNNIHFVARRHATMKSDFRKGHRMEKNDHLVIFKKPDRSPSSVCLEMLEKLPTAITIREVKFRVKRNGFRVKMIYLVTSLLDHKKYSIEDLANLYAERWNVELDFRAIKMTLNMDVLRCKTPAMIEKEIWVHMLGYNIIRAIMFDAAVKKKLKSGEVSFKETVQFVNNFVLLSSIVKAAGQRKYYEVIIESLKDRVKNRPGRIEPRLLRHNPEKYPLLKRTREETRKEFWKLGTAREQRKIDKAKKMKKPAA